MTALDGSDPTRQQPAHVARWFYSGVWSWLVRWIRVPDEPPTLPAAAGQFHLSFQPAPALLRYWKFTYWIGVGVLGAGWLASAVGLTLFVHHLWSAGVVAGGTAVFVALAGMTYLALHLRYDTMWYVLTDRSMRVRRGIWIIHETTITFENVQNVRITEGPLQRWFGIADVRVDTAGGGAPVANQQAGVSDTSHCGVIEGVANASEIRDLILSKLKKSRTAGLGDEVHGHPHDGMPSTLTKMPGVGAQHLAVLREIRDLMRAR